jgi:PAS domain S-box-containing protein
MLAAMASADSASAVEGGGDGRRFHATPEELDAAMRFFGRVTSDLITVFDRQRRILFVNPTAERVLGLPRNACLGRDLFEFVHDEERPAALAAFERWCQANGDNLLLIETRVVARVGELRHLHWTVAPYRDQQGQVYCFISHARDVTPQVLAGERLQKNEVRHRALLGGVLDPLITIDGRGTVHEASRSVEELFGYRSEELIGRNISMLMVEPHASNHDSYLERYRRTGETGILNRTRAFEVRHKEGRIIQVELSVSRVEIPGEGAPLFVGSFRDVTARRAAERALAEKEARMRAIFDQEYEFVGLLDRQGMLLEVNHSALRGIGRERQEVVGRAFWDTPWWQKDSLRSERVRAAVEAAAQGEFVRFEVSYVDREGRERWVDFSLKPVRDEQGNVQFLLPEGRDISRLKASHARELALNQALAEIGQSASLLAHEIKNPLTAVNLALRAVADKLGEDQRVVLDDLATRLAKLERTMRRTLAFTRPLELELEPLEVGEVLHDVARLLGPELDAARVKLEILCPSDLELLRADRGRLEEVLLNLVRNSREALETGGHVRLAAAMDGPGQVLLSVEDDGPGLAPSIRASLFTPFVTSKAAGTGLGLAIARKIVREHGGEIGVRDSALGGAAFWIRLPTSGRTSALGRSADPASAYAAEEAGSLRSGETGPVLDSAPPLRSSR